MQRYEKTRETQKESKLFFLYFRVHSIFDIVKGTKKREVFNLSLVIPAGFKPTTF